MEKLRYPESCPAVRVEEARVRIFALSVAVVSVLIPHRIATVCTVSKLIRYIRQNQPRLLYIVRLPVLKAVTIHCNTLHLFAASCTMSVSRPAVTASAVLAHR